MIEANEGVLKKNSDGIPKRGRCHIILRSNLRYD